MAVFLGRHWAEVDDMKDVLCEWHDGLPSVPVNQIHIAVWERTALYQKTITSTKLNEETATVQRKQTGPTQALGGGLSLSNPLSPKVFRLKEPPLLGREAIETNRKTSDVRISKQVGNTFKIAPIVSHAVKKLQEKNHATVGHRFLVENKTHLEENDKSKKRTNVNNFEPYIPRKKRHTAAEGGVTNSSEVLLVSNDGSSSSLSTAKGERLGGKTGNKSTNVPPWSDPISVHVDEKQKQAVLCDTQSDSGYSSPGSNSSCVSLTTPSTKQEPNLNEFLESLDGLDLPGIINSSRCEPDTANEDSGSSKKPEEVGCDDFFGVIFSQEEFQRKESEMKITTTNDSSNLSPSTCLLEPCDDGNMEWLGCESGLDKFIFTDI